MPTFCKDIIEELLQMPILENWGGIVGAVKGEARNAYKNLVSTTTNSGPSEVGSFCRFPVLYSTTPDLAIQLWRKVLTEFGQQLQNRSFGYVRQFLEIHAF